MVSVRIWVGAKVVKVSNRLTMEVVSISSVEGDPVTVDVSKTTIVEVKVKVEAALCVPETVWGVVVGLRVVVENFVIVVDLAVVW